MAQTLSADIVIVGSGVCGALAARKLAASGASVLVLEAGPRIERDDIVRNFRATPFKSDLSKPYPNSPFAPWPDYVPADNGYLEQVGPYPYLPQYLRMVGGTSWHWAAQAWRFVPNDFHIKSLYGVGKDWPFGYDELEPYYHEAEVHWGVSGQPEMAKYSPRSKPFPMEAVAPSYLEQRVTERLAPQFEVLRNTCGRNSRTYDDRPACCGNNNCQPICPIDAQYTGGIAVRHAEAAGVKVIPEAVVYKLEHDERGRITALNYYDWGKTSYRVTGKTFILAANAIETPKLLFMSASSRFPNGLANSSGTLGQNLMDHPSSSLAFDVDEPIWAGRGPQSPSSIQQLRDGAFRSEHAPYRIDFSNMSQVANVTAEAIAAGLTGKALEAYIRDHASRRISIKNVLEQLPEPKNRVMLGEGKDALGLPKPRFSYSFDDYVNKGMAASMETYLEIARMLGGTHLVPSKPGQYSNNQHICGTLSMGKDAATSVTDSVGRAHDHENLYMVSTGVMPTLGTCNSTLTATALSLRTADAILGKI